ncbi:E3 ubiquitin-protein ligase pellino homolog 2-like [Asterias rubens]|uniref:E3 ubiquitin-protein ligase pellino homolog 2-like n=1 Tax=Asterias rubens TaxID=7604 RepID=UPI0014552448|nr:E3 ubiquitin-protein ligase pellino homolog 2-like [Asterias rubens]
MSCDSDLIIDKMPLLKSDPEETLEVVTPNPKSLVQRVEIPANFQEIDTDAKKSSLGCSTVKYGELVILGYNGCLPSGNRGRRRSRFGLFKRETANGVKPDRQYEVSPQKGGQGPKKGKHTIAYTLSRHQTVVVEYSSDQSTDMFQIGRSTEPVIDFVVMDTVPGAKSQEECTVAESTISRFACRIICDRETPHTARIYAAGFNSGNNIFLGEKACKWKTEFGMDGLTTNGVLIMRPRGGFQSDARPGVWREVSVGGNIYSLRETRSSQQKGKLIDDENNILEDGTLIDLCGATLLWRSATGLLKTPTQKHLELLRQGINDTRPQCPIGFNTLVLPKHRHASKQIVDENSKQPYAYLKCGHVHGYHMWDSKSTQQKTERTCPMCREAGSYEPLIMGNEPSFYVDSGNPTHAYVPCGHVCSEKTVKYWSQVPLPHGTHAFQAACPFCAMPLCGDTGYIKLIFQEAID